MFCRSATQILLSVSPGWQGYLSIMYSVSLLQVGLEAVSYDRMCQGNLTHCTGVVLCTVRRC